MTEEKIVEIVNGLAELCRSDEFVSICSTITGWACPFTEKACPDITQEDWLKWMEEGISPNDEWSGPIEMPLDDKRSIE